MGDEVEMIEGEPTQIVRVLRILEVIGPRKWVEGIMDRRYVKGTTHFRNGAHIREGIVGQYPESLGADLNGEVTQLINAVYKLDLEKFIAADVRVVQAMAANLLGEP